MVFSSLATNELEYLELPNQVDCSENSLVNQAFVHVAQLAAEKLQQAHPSLVDSNNHTQTISIRAIEPEYRHFLFIEPLSPRELEVLQLIVEGNKNLIIAQKLYISGETVKTHVRNILKKLCVRDRTQAAIRALRSGLVH